MEISSLKDRQKKSAINKLADFLYIFDLSHIV